MRAAAPRFYAHAALKPGFPLANTGTLFGVFPGSSSGTKRSRSARAGQSPMMLAASRSSILPPVHLLQLALQILDLFLQRDHLQLATNHDLFELLQVENLLLQFGLRFLQVAHNLFIGTHITQNTDSADHLTIGIT